jgi:hypothetical protein
LEKWEEFWINIYPFGKREMLYTYIVNNNNNFSIEENEFSYKDNFTHFRFNFA